MSRFEGLSFAPCPVQIAKGKSDPAVSVAVRKDDAIKVSFNSAAYARLGLPDAIAVETATTDEGAFLKLTPAAKDQGWPVNKWTTRPGAAPTGSITIRSRPFEIGLTHNAIEVEIEWQTGGGMVLALPDWDAMLAGISSGAEADA